MYVHCRYDSSSDCVRRAFTAVMMLPACPDCALEKVTPWHTSFLPLLFPSYQVNDKSPLKIKNVGIWLRYDSRSGTHNMYREYRDLTIAGAVTQCCECCSVSWAACAARASPAPAVHKECVL